MTRIGILEPASLVGIELCQRLAGGPASSAVLPSPDDIEALTVDPEQVGAIAEVAGRPALVAMARPENVADLDILVCCGADHESTVEVASWLAAGGTTVVLGQGCPLGWGTPVVFGVNGTEIAPGRVLISPHPGVVALALVLGPLVDLGLTAVFATIIQSASVCGQRALDEVLEQTRAVLGFRELSAGEVFDRQVAFNMIDTGADARTPAAHLEAILFGRATASLRLIQSGVFHGVMASVYCRFSIDPGVAELEQRLGQLPLCERVGDGRTASPVTASGLERVLVGRLTTDDHGGYWLWLACDNLMRGGALNGIEILGALHTLIHGAATAN